MAGRSVVKIFLLLLLSACDERCLEIDAGNRHIVTRALVGGKLVEEVCCCCCCCCCRFVVVVVGVVDLLLLWMVRAMRWESDAGNWSIITMALVQGMAVISTIE